ncbi:PhzF family phenazine biosynthesis protein [Flavobacterium silvisoli]|uniref:PhzF family phenazine biosynthesis protein n=1 Tax=Flavobacterium silvisoli TaxID=2529433 RepID=A0A4Q9YVT5_9FLAO|nr:PhzF family phenazine biosynthesis protein [Flavobacterium silvisoli]TBX66142.1 PhzF family phenazine biosynthesis protein [Flavobacterium silvisoli]
MENNLKTEVQIINAFVDNNAGGNSAGVVLNADHLSNKQKLSIAQKIGLSETAFVSKSTLADFKLDFFTPKRQIAHCGHATIAVFSYLSQLNLIQNSISSKETIDGTRDILITENLAFMEQKTPYYQEVPALEQKILQSLGITGNDILSEAPISLVNTGNSFIIVPVKNATTLKNIKPDYDLINQISEELDLVGFYIFCTETSHRERVASTRMFAPRYGIDEEAATGMAAGPLACYLFDKLHLKNNRMFVRIQTNLDFS